MGWRFYTPEVVGKKLRELREKRKLSLRQVEIRTGIKYSYLALIEQGKRKLKKKELFQKLASLYGVHPSSFMVSFEDWEHKTMKPTLTENESFVLSAFRRLGEDDKKELMNYLNFKLTKKKIYLSRPDFKQPRARRRGGASKTPR